MLLTKPRSLNKKSSNKPKIQIPVKTSSTIYAKNHATNMHLSKKRISNQPMSICNLKICFIHFPPAFFPRERNTRGTSVCLVSPAAAAAQGPIKTGQPLRRPKNMKRTPGSFGFEVGPLEAPKPKNHPMLDPEHHL